MKFDQTCQPLKLFDSLLFSWTDNKFWEPIAPGNPLGSL